MPINEWLGKLSQQRRLGSLTCLPASGIVLEGPHVPGRATAGDQAIRINQDMILTAAHSGSGDIRCQRFPVEYNAQSNPNGHGCMLILEFLSHGRKACCASAHMLPCHHVKQTLQPCAA